MQGPPRPQITVCRRALWTSRLGPVYHDAMKAGDDHTQAAAKARRDRLSAALRDNLRRRKAARRAQAGCDGAHDDPAPAAQPRTDDDAP